jgi:3-oxoadipate enol-lactonase
MWSWARLLPEVWLSSVGSVDTMVPIGSLAARYRVAVFDQAGVGLSATVAPARSADEAATDALRVGRDLLGEQFTVVGMSLGGAAAARAALLAPEAVRRLMLVCTFASASTLHPYGTASPTSGGDLDVSDEVRRSLRPWFVEANPELVASVTAASLATPLHPGLGDSSIGVFLSHDGHDLASLAVPTPIVCGESDTVFPIANSEAIARLVPDSKLVRVPKAGHALHLERPDEILRALDDLHSDRSSG